MMLSKVSLASLRTFASVAQLGSLSLAAEQLCISPSAVSHQMKLLEQQLDLSLFVRRSRGIELTGPGQKLAEHAIKSMQQLESGLQETSQHSKQQLCIAAIPTFMQYWLVPRLQGFYDAYPDIELNLIDHDSLIDFNQQAVDLHLHFGSGEFVGLKSQLLMKEWALPVCSPKLITSTQDAHALLTSSTLRRLAYTAFEEDKPGGLSWEGWHNQTGQAHLSQQTGHRPITYFNHMGPLITAAKQGQGIALTWQGLVELELMDNTLVALSQLRVPLKYAYYAVAPEHHFERPLVAAFLEWICSEIEQT